MNKSVKVTIAGAVLFVGSLFLGMGGAILGMIRSFNQTASSGHTSPAELSEGIGLSLTATLIAIPAAFIGLCLLIGGLIACFGGKNRADNETNAEAT